jgi:hydroxysqualene synthase
MHNRAPVSVEHYENFPVASWLCPPAMRPPITAIYGFARTADDFADEGTTDVQARLAVLAAYREELTAVHAGAAPSARWAQVFVPLQRAILEHRLPLIPLDNLLDAFMQDCSNPVHPDRDSLLDYCRRSANPVGRLLLHLYGVHDATACAQSDAVCTALQLINFWQDLSVDLPRGRCYLPEADLRRHGLSWPLPNSLHPFCTDRPAAQALVKSLCTWAGDQMRAGQGLVYRLPGRAGWELRLVVQGGLRILEKIADMDYDSFTSRPHLTGWDGLPLAWRALTMRRT